MGVICFCKYVYMYMYLCVRVGGGGIYVCMDLYICNMYVHIYRGGQVPFYQKYKGKYVPIKRMNIK